MDNTKKLQIIALLYRNIYVHIKEKTCKRNIRNHKEKKTEKRNKFHFNLLDLFQLHICIRV